MAYLGILLTSGGLFVTVLISYLIVRVKEARFRRVIEVLEWLALHPIEEEPRSEDKPTIGESLREVRSTWNRSQRIFDLSYGKYLVKVWNATYQDLCWANSFGVELSRMSETLIYPDEAQYEQNLSNKRDRIIARHIQDFNKLTIRILQLDDNNKI